MKYNKFFYKQEFIFYFFDLIEVKFRNKTNISVARTIKFTLCSGLLG